MNLNQKIPDLPANAGIGTMRDRISQCIECANWLRGIRGENGATISDGARGPVINVPAAIPDISAIGLCNNFRQAHQTATFFGSNPYVITYDTSTTITPPSVCAPRFYMESFQSVAQGFNGPCFPLGGAIAGDFTYSLTIDYNGSTVFAVSGSNSTVAQSGGGFACYLPVPQSGWIYDPAGLVGYSQGSGYWIWEFNGAASLSTLPTIVLTFSYVATPAQVISSLLPWSAVFMQGP